MVSAWYPYYKRNSRTFFCKITENDFFPLEVTSDSRRSAFDIDYDTSPDL